MTEPASLRDDEAGLPAGGPADAPQPPPTPRWVKIAAAVVALVVLAVLAKLAFGGGVGSHGPGIHTGLGDQPVPTLVAATAAGSARTAPALP